MCVCACHPEHKRNESIPHFLRISKSHAKHIKQRYISSSSGTTSSSTHAHGIACVPPLQLATPPGSQVYHISQVNLVLLCTKWTFLAHGHFSLFRPRVFIVLSVAGHAGGPREHWVQVWALAVVRGTCSEGSKSRKLVNNHRIRFRPPRASQVPCKTRTTVFSSAKKMIICFCNAA